ncbi:hypothetical protein [Streptomyces sp. NPDC127119]|uniref:hypothetical protein n=1 Tax=Streptomyces sp. NPDC127119 TaxID=3345370 RepID=UPI00362F2BEF
MDLTDGRGTDAVIDAVGMEAHGTPASNSFAVAGRCPSPGLRRRCQPDAPFQAKEDGTVKTLPKP